MNEGVKRLVEQGNDPLKVMCEGAHAAGKDFFLRMRLNDLHDRVGQHANLAAPTRKPKTGFMEPVHYTPKWEKDHPEWLIGDARAVPSHLSFEAVEANAPNYLYAPVRELMFALAAEVVRGYDIDGFEIDFHALPVLLPPREGLGAPARDDRLRAKAASDDRRGGEPPRAADHLLGALPRHRRDLRRIGVDVPALLAEGLLDMCVISGGYMPFSIPWEDVVSLAGEHGVPTLACLNYSRVTRWNWMRTQTGLHPEPSPQQILEQIRAAAHRAYQKGASGVELWNFFYEMPHYSPEQKDGTHRLGYEFTHELADPEGLAGRKKAYLFDYEMGERWAHACWCGQGPLMIATADDGIGQSITFDVADDLDRFPDASAELWINIVDLFADDVIEFEWNGRPLPPRAEPYMGLIVYSNRGFRFDLPAEWVKRGNNEFTVCLRERSPRLEAYVTLNFVRLTIDPGGATGTMV